MENLVVDSIKSQSCSCFCGSYLHGKKAHLSQGRNREIRRKAESRLKLIRCNLGATVYWIVTKSIN